MFAGRKLNYYLIFLYRDKEKHADLQNFKYRPVGETSRPADAVGVKSLFYVPVHIRMVLGNGFRNVIEVKNV